ncbi:GNAT family N-acetyltransferase [Flavobacterium sp. GA093]|uniref:GNAT family N-acetyltransferase n=1 Tax=Flavobacterium hydrocarbonoxydans TaxID=2683249 RepID=A0A6I4NMU0_9FLAO|nr:GNAT family N-acetyltransferase [Flavobacterium hydrocarbonoxydans]MWB95413.1 GNAT family N-acetyltransferase [Flavobacterium hydrocarbonoxydans]
MTTERNKLDNPVWFSLNETHKDKAIVFEDVQFYQPDYCPFGGFTVMDETANALKQYSNSISNFYIVGNLPKFNNSLLLNKELVCNQMVLDTTIVMDTDEEIVALQSEHQKELFELVNLVQPGYFKNKTSELGQYYGIFKNDMLVAVTGERMKMDTFTEVSAVVTHPEYTGQGLAKRLVSHTANQIFLQNKIPYLHVAETNTGAIHLYEKLGFVTRRKISFWNFIKAE